jgi:GT2 family glycosyltransferase
MDDDDYLEPGGLSRMLVALREAEKKVRVGTYYAYGNVVVSEGPVITPDWTPEINRDQFRTGNAMLWHRSLFGTVAEYYHPSDLALYFEDYDFCAQLEASGVLGMHVDTIVTYHRITAGGVTERARKLGFVDAIRARINERYEG